VFAVFLGKIFSILQLGDAMANMCHALKGIIFSNLKENFLL